MALMHQFAPTPMTNVSTGTNSGDYITVYPTEWNDPYEPPEDKFLNGDQEALLAILITMLEKAGGEIVVSDEEIQRAKGHVVLSESDVAGFRKLTLLPEYVAIGREDPEPDLKERGWQYAQHQYDNQRTSTVDASDWWKQGTATWDWKPSKGPGVKVSFKADGTFTLDDIAPAVAQLQPESEKAVSALDKFTAKLTSIFSEEKNKEVTNVADKNAKRSTPVEQPAPPQGGGLNTIDPTFANQTNSAPKESKPSSKSDVTRKR